MAEDTPALVSVKLLFSGGTVVAAVSCSPFVFVATPPTKLSVSWGSAVAVISLIISLILSITLGTEQSTTFTTTLSLLSAVKSGVCLRVLTAFETLETISSVLRLLTSLLFSEGAAVTSALSEGAAVGATVTSGEGTVGRVVGAVLG